MPTGSARGITSYSRLYIREPERRRSRLGGYRGPEAASDAMSGLGNRPSWLTASGGVRTKPAQRDFVP
jgi:hypothetical protein